MADKPDVVAEHMRLCGFNARGEEIPDPRPVALPVGFKRPQSLQERMKYLLRSEELQRAQERAGIETFDEADDFEVDEQDPLQGTPYEDDFDPERPGAIAREQELRAGYVEDIRPEKKARAKDLHEKVKAHFKKPKADPKKDEEK